MLNLLPPEYKERYKVYSRAYGVALVYFVILVLIGLSIVGIATYGFIQQGQISDKETQLASLNSQKATYNETAAKAAFIEDRLNSNAQYQDQQDWNSVLGSIAASTPSDVQLTSIKTALINQTTPTVTVTGSTANRRSIVLFKDKLATASGIKAPTLQSMTEKTDGSSKTFDFTITMGVSK
jgi:Tfp pilus assembly protein PilN